MKAFIKALALVLALIMACSAFAACTSNQKPGDNVAPPDKNTSSNNGNGENNNANNKENTDTDQFPSLDVAEKTTRGEESSIPNFTERQIKNQKIMGASIVEEIREAASDLSRSSFTIPPGNYGFDMDKYFSGENNVPYGFALDNIQRPDDNPFTIYADGVTFWIDPTGKECPNTSYAFVLKNCSNIKILGLTIDEYTPNDIEGTVTKIDKQNNRIAIKLTNSSMLVSDEVISLALGGKQCRIVPYKSDGTFIAPLYKISTAPGREGWGPGAMQVSDFGSTGEENEYWITFNTKLLINTVLSSEWKSTYGEAGIIEEGDVISLLFGNVMTNLVNCKQITIEGMNNHCTKGMIAEIGGYGAHVWKDCYFGPRPGSSKVMSAGEGMRCGTRVGTTLDNVTIMASSDDQVNIHGYLSTISKINSNVLKIQYVYDGVLFAGDTAEFYDPNGNLVLTRTIAEDVTNGDFKSRTVKFTEPVDEKYKSCTIRWPSQECDGWVIKNCTFINNYQRILLQSGSGTFENNKVLNMGYNMSINNIFNVSSIYEGGILGKITIKNNVFYNSSTSPELYLIQADQSYNFDGKMLGEKLDIENNLFINCGYILSARNFCDVSFKNNIIIAPNSLGLNATDIACLVDKKENVEKFVVKNNLLYTTGIENGDGIEPTNKNCNLSPTLLGKIQNYVKYTDADALKIIKTVKANLTANF